MQALYALPHLVTAALTAILTPFVGRRGAAAGATGYTLLLVAATL